MSSGDTVSAEASRALSTLSPDSSLKRRSDFVRGRNAAAECLRELGFPDRVVGRHPSGAPEWPEGIVGSITHSHGWAIAVTGSTADFQTIGIDLERRRSGAYHLAEHLCHPREREWVDEVWAERDLRVVMIFAAKEALFKALSHTFAGGDFPGFAQVCLEDRGGFFEARFEYPPTFVRNRFEVRYEVQDNFVFALHARPRRHLAAVPPAGGSA